MWAPPSIGQSSRARPHLCQEERVTEGWVCLPLAPDQEAGSREKIGEERQGKERGRAWKYYRVQLGRKDLEEL